MTSEEKSIDIASHLWRYNETGQAQIIAQAIHEAVAEEREACARLAEAQADDISHELPNSSGGSWAKRFGRNVALSIAAAIRSRNHA